MTTVPSTPALRTPNDAPSFEERRKSLMLERPDLFAVNSKYAPKLSFVERCAVYAYWKAGVERRLLAVTFGINRGTVNFIVTPSSPHYKNVRKEFQELGLEQFGRTYMSDEWDAKIKEARKTVDVTLSDDELKASKEALAEPNKRASSKEGEHTVFYPGIGSQEGQSGKVKIEWMTHEGATAWFATVDPFGVMGTGHTTSAAALKAFLEENMAELV